jgi:hypothetical protein
MTVRELRRTHARRARLRRWRGSAGVSCPAAIELSTLVEYWLGELDAESEADAEEHLLGCGGCTARLDDLVRLGAGVRRCFARGDVSAVLTAGFIRSLADAGWRLREYRVPANGSVNCTVAPGDDLTVARLQASLAGIERLDLVRSTRGTVFERLSNVPFDAAAGEVVFAPAMTALRALRDEAERVELVASAEGTERVVAGYDFVHSAWKG